MLRPRLTWLLLIIVTIILGLLSRRFAFIPMFVGDILWAALIYFLFRFVWVKTSVKRIVVCSLVFSFAIEFSQLYTAPWIASLRHTLFGRLVLGSTFYWWDLVCYTAGVFIGAGTERYITGNKYPRGLQ